MNRLTKSSPRPGLRTKAGGYKNYIAQTLNKQQNLMEQNKNTPQPPSQRRHKLQIKQHNGGTRIIKSDKNK